MTIPLIASARGDFSAKCKDVSELLVELGPVAPRHPMALQVAFHDPCHLQHAQGLRDQPRAALKSIPGLELLELPEAALCCGSAGIYNLVQPESARQLGQRKVEKIIATRAQMVATGNPGCQLQLNSLLNGNGHPAPGVALRAVTGHFDLCRKERWRLTKPERNAFAYCFGVSEGVILSEAKDLLFTHAEDKADPSIACPNKPTTGLKGPRAKSARPQDDTSMAAC